MCNGHGARHGQFAVGNPDGPGRPRRAVERECLAALGEAVSLADRREVVQAAVTAAKQGTAKPRTGPAATWVGEKRPLPTDLAADLGAEHDILDRVVKRQKARDFLETFDSDQMGKAREQLWRMRR